MRKALLTANLPTNRDWIVHRIHATLGFYVASHFILRHVWFFQHYDMGLAHPSMSLPTTSMVLLPHLLLQLTGLQFEIPRKRTPDGNRIWPEYRWHGFIFCIRCLFLCALSKIDWHYSDGDAFLRYCIVICTMICADRVSAYYRSIGEASTTTIRGLNGPSGMLFLMSATQFHINVHCLHASTINAQHRYHQSLHVPFTSLMVVQLSAFGMTLRRKGWIGLQFGLCLYAGILLIGMVVLLHDLKTNNRLANIVIGNLAVILRMELRWNKYFLWTITALVLWVDSSLSLSASSPLLRGVFNDDKRASITEEYTMLGIVATTGLLVCCALRRQFGNSRNEAATNDIRKQR